jgi:CheY-like chemotaxis protein
VVGICRRTFDRKIEIDVQGDTSAWVVVGDRGQLYQALLNLCINARDAVEELVRSDSEQLPRLVLKTCATHLDAAECAAHPEARPGPYVRLTVADNGCGMDEETRERIFEPFFTTKGVGRGTGLGMAIVYSAVKQHGGWIDVQSEPGKGTAFKILLPARAGVRSEPAEPRDTGLARGTETVLVVDDESSVRSMLVSLLTRCGYTVLTAQDGEEGVAILSREKKEIDLVLLDLSMPRMSGLQALARMRSIEPGVKVIVQTGYADEAVSLEETIEVIAKPFQVRALLATVRKVLDDRPGDTPPATSER